VNAQSWLSCHSTEGEDRCGEAHGAEKALIGELWAPGMPQRTIGGAAPGIDTGAWRSPMRPSQTAPGADLILRRRVAAVARWVSWTGWHVLAGR
jgi:hypothetical protein